MPKKNILSKNAIEKIIRKGGALRVSQSAKQALVEVLEEKALKIAQEAKSFAEHAGRKTVTEKDIMLAIKSI